jgi:protoporphyrin/coproporphyrin ferrochelatase
MKKLAVVLFNLGGPLENKDVKPFLYNLFVDPNIIGLPFGLRHFVARMISSRREKPAQANYQMMGGGSPILAQTEAQAKALEAKLKGLMKDVEVKVIIAMRYWHPFTEQAVAEVEAFAPDRVVLLPLYPQFSKTTSFSSIARFTELYKGAAEVKTICCYPTADYFIKAHVDTIKKAIKPLKNLSNYRLLFSAHGLPEKVIKSGDPYQSQVEATVKSVMAGLDTDIDHIICYQSRVGPMKWIGPSTDETIRETGKLGKNVILVPIAFVSEHIETLVELDIEYAELAHQAGIEDYIRVPALGVNPDFIRTLSDEVLRAVGSLDTVASAHNCDSCHRHCPKLKTTDLRRVA